VNANTSYLKSLGARIRSEANDLKRTPEVLARELGMRGEIVNSVLAGDANIETAQNMLLAMSEVYPISLADIWVDADDTDHGIRLMTAESSKESSRVFDRPDKNGKQNEYYEYRDTAMSRGSPFKPEWILELRCIEDLNPDNPDVAFNNGHLMHQTTFFIGPVNFYWEVDGKRHCVEMDTGDSNYITPYVPHSFASRDPDRPGLIIAVTFSGLVGRALRDFISIGVEAAERAAGDLRDENSFHHRLTRHCNAESISLKNLEARAIKNGMNATRAQMIVAGDALPDSEELETLASLLVVRPSDLMVYPLDRRDEVVVQRFGEKGSRPFPDDNSPAYQITELARSRQQPYMKGFELTVLGGGNGQFEHCLHEYVYNYGDEPVELIWEPERSAILNPGDSACIRPLVPHRFEKPDGANAGHLIVIRVPGQLTDQVLDEYATFAVEGRSRVAAEMRRWF
jgi:methylphosphonate synthase